MPAKSPINHGMIRGTLKAGGCRRTGLSNSIMLSFDSFAAGLNITERHGCNGVRYQRPRRTRFPFLARLLQGLFSGAGMTQKSLEWGRQGEIGWDDCV